MPPERYGRAGRFCLPLLQRLPVVEIQADPHPGFDRPLQARLVAGPEFILRRLPLAGFDQRVPPLLLCLLPIADNHVPVHQLKIRRCQALGQQHADRVLVQVDDAGDKRLPGKSLDPVGRRCRRGAPDHQDRQAAKSRSSQRRGKKDPEQIHGFFPFLSVVFLNIFAKCSCALSDINCTYSWSVFLFGKLRINLSPFRTRIFISLRYRT